MKLLGRTEAAYWLTLTFKLEGERKRDRNGLVLTASRRLNLGLLDLVLLDVERLPEPLQRFRKTLERLQAAEPEVSGMAFLVDELADRGVEVVPITHSAYPPHLALTLKPDSAPTMLTVVGNLSLLQAPGACISGSRKASREGLRFAAAAGESLARASVTVVTGLASGPDREGLVGCLGAGGGAIGIAPEGILASRATRDAAVRDGRLAVVSEFHPKHAWQAGLAMARNRTLAGMSKALFVADCVAAGGTTNQVDVHLAAGLPVFVRRGTGEGALVAGLAGRTGVFALPWEDGPVRLPALEADGSRPAQAVTVDEAPAGGVDVVTSADREERARTLSSRLETMSRQLRQAEATIAGLLKEVASLSEVARQCEAELSALRATSAIGEVSNVEAAVSILRDSESPRPYDQATNVAKRIVEALRLARGALTLAEIVSSVGIELKVARAELKQLTARKEVSELKRRGVPTVYSLHADLALFSGTRAAT